MSESQSFTLSVPRGIALYVGALLGPGLLLLPGLAARQAGPASIVAWAGLLGVSALFAVVFAAMGRAHPRANGVAGYAAAGLGATAGRVVGWCFLTGVIGGAPVVCLIGAGYVTSLTGGGLVARGLVAAALLLVVLALALGGVRASSTAQLVLVALLIVIIALAVGGSAPAARAGNWTPFAPDGWSAIGRAAATLMLSFVGWEAVAPLTTRFRNPDRDLPRVIGAAFGVTAVLYLALAVTTIAVLGPAAGTDVPLASLLVRAVGQAMVGPLSDRFGRRRPLMIGMGLYILGAVACACAPNPLALDAARLVQAMGGCAGTVLARACVRDIFPPGEAMRSPPSLLCCSHSRVRRPHPPIPAMPPTNKPFASC